MKKKYILEMFMVNVETIRQKKSAITEMNNKEKESEYLTNENEM